MRGTVPPPWDRRSGNLRERATAAAKAAETSAKEAGKARTALEKAEADWGGAPQMASLRSRAEGLAGGRAEEGVV